MKLINRIKEWLFNKLVNSSIEIDCIETLNINCDIRTNRCKQTFSYLKNMIKEIEPDLEDRMHLFIIDIKESGNGDFYIIDDLNGNYSYKFDSRFCLELYKILCGNNKYEVIDSGHFLNLKSDEGLRVLVIELIKNINQQENININPEQYWKVSKVKAGHTLNGLEFLRFYGIGCDEAEMISAKGANPDELFESMLRECIGYIESPADRYTIDTYKIRDEYASQILDKYKVINNSELITQIASTRYESEECSGSILFCHDADTEGCPLIQFEKIELKLENIRVIRKYLEMAKNEYCLWAKKEGDKYYIYGIDKNEKENRSEFTLLQFTGYRKWKIENQDQDALLEWSGETYSIPKMGEKTIRVKKSLKLLLSGCQNNLCRAEEVNHLVYIAEIARKQSHGTMIIFTHPDEAEKLTNYFSEKNRGIKLIKKVNLTEKEHKREELEKLLLNLSAIDGALIIDTEGQCHAVGVILDGIANIQCDMARGARYNSALTFITNRDFEKIYEFKREKCKVFVFSEDKTVDILPDDTQKVSMVI